MNTNVFPDHGVGSAVPVLNGPFSSPARGRPGYRSARGVTCRNVPGRSRPFPTVPAIPRPGRGLRRTRVKSLDWITTTYVLLMAATVAFLLFVGGYAYGHDPEPDGFPCGHDQLWDGNQCFDRDDHAGHEGQ